MNQPSLFDEDHVRDIAESKVIVKESDHPRFWKGEILSGEEWENSISMYGRSATGGPKVKPGQPEFYRELPF